MVSCMSLWGGCILTVCLEVENKEAYNLNFAFALSVGVGWKVFGMICQYCIDNKWALLNLMYSQQLKCVTLYIGFISLCLP